MTTKSILIISRDKALQHTRKLILECAGYRVSAAGTDDEAVKAVEVSTSYSIVLLCHSVPERSRLFLVNKLKELQPTLPIPDGVQQLRSNGSKSGRLITQSRITGCVAGYDCVFNYPQLLYSAHIKKSLLVHLVSWK